jgi:hypothetical protein
VRAGHGRQHGDQRHQGRAGGERVREQRLTGVSAGQPLGHDPGTHDGGSQECRAQALCRSTLCQARRGARAGLADDDGTGLYSHQQI